MHQQPFARPGVRQLEDVEKHGEENLRHRACFFVAERVRNAHHRSMMRNGFLRVPAAGKEGHGPLAAFPPLHVGADLDHLARALEAEDGRGAGGRRIVSFALQQVGAIDRGGAHADAQLIGSEWRRVDLADVEDGFVAVMIEDDGAHAR